MKTEPQRLADLENMVINLIWHYTVLAAYFEPKPEHTEARQAHPEFSLTMYEALLSSSAVLTRNLFKEGDEAESLPNFIDHIGKTRHISAISDRLKAKQRSLDDTLETLKELRNSVYAHRSQNQSPEVIFAKLKPKFNMFKDVAEFAKEVILELVDENRRALLKSQMFSNSTLEALENDTRSVLKTFKENCEIG